MTLESAVAAGAMLGLTLGLIGGVSTLLTGTNWINWAAGFATGNRNGGVQ